MPTLTPDQITRVVVGRILAQTLGTPISAEAAARWRRIQADPEAAALARRIDARVRYLNEHAEDPRARFERLAGFPWPWEPPD